MLSKQSAGKSLVLVLQLTDMTSQWKLLSVLPWSPQTALPSDLGSILAQVAGPRAPGTAA